VYDRIDESVRQDAPGIARTAEKNCARHRQKNRAQVKVNIPLPATNRLGHNGGIGDVGMKSLGGCFSVIGFCAVVVIVIVIIAAMNNQPATNPVIAPDGTQDTEEQTASDETPDSSTDLVTMAEFNEIETGMTWEEVVAIAGQPTEELSRNKIADIETVMYQWTNPFGPNMNVMFQNGKVVQKAQFGLK
jgi:hypothetical protein